MELTAPLLEGDHGSGAAGRPAGTPLRSRSTTAAPTPVRSRSPAPGGGAGRLAPMPEDEQLPPSAFEKAVSAAPIAAGRPLLALGYAGSLPHDIEAAVNISAAGAGEAPGWLPPGASAARFASLPDIHSEARLQEQHPQRQQQQQASYWANRQLRCAPADSLLAGTACQTKENAWRLERAAQLLTVACRLAPPLYPPAGPTKCLPASTPPAPHRPTPAPPHPLISPWRSTRLPAPPRGCLPTGTAPRGASSRLPSPRCLPAGTAPLWRTSSRT